MKKKIIIVFGLLLIVICGIVVFFNLKKDDKYTGEKFKVESKYYNEGNFISLSSSEVESLLDNKESFIIFTYNNYCMLPIPCEDIFKESFSDLKIDIVNITFEDFKNTSLYDTVKIAPSIIIIKKGKIVDYLHADKDEDLQRYQDKNEFISWLKEYIITK